MFRYVIVLTQTPSSSNDTKFYMYHDYHPMHRTQSSFTRYPLLSPTPLHTVMRSTHPLNLLETSPTLPAISCHFPSSCPRVLYLLVPVASPFVHLALVFLQLVSWPSLVSPTPIALSSGSLVLSHALCHTPAQSRAYSCPCSHLDLTHALSTFLAFALALTFLLLPSPMNS